MKKGIDMRKEELKVCFAIATANRKEVLSETLSVILSVGEIPDTLIVCPAKVEEVDRDIYDKFNIEKSIVTGCLGLPAQRNLILESCKDDIVVFLDDDFIPAPGFIKNIKRTFEFSNVVALTGKVIADGILSEGISHKKALTIIHSVETDNTDLFHIEDTYSTYGCNMAFRLSVIKNNDIKFDENLPLYGWLEDLDFSRRVAPYGRVVKANHVRGVHLGTKRSGRSPGKQLGYSQISNPIYLAQKGSMSWFRALRQISRNIVANIVKAPRPEKWVDRFGRVKGNFLGLYEFFIGKLDPKRILELKK